MLITKSGRNILMTMNPSRGAGFNEDNGRIIGERNTVRGSCVEEMLRLPPPIETKPKSIRTFSTLHFIQNRT